MVKEIQEILLAIHKKVAKEIVNVTHLINATLRLKHSPILWKIEEVIMIPKPGNL